MLICCFALPVIPQVSATDNSPACFNGIVAYRQDPLHDEPRVCSSRIVYHLLRTWNTTDGANNTAMYQQMVAVRDVEVIKFPLAVLSLPSRGSVSYTLRVPDPLPNKRYTWVVTRTNTLTALSRSKTGNDSIVTSSVCFIVSQQTSMVSGHPAFPNKQGRLFTLLSTSRRK